MVKGIIGGVIGGIVGAIIWAVLAHYTDREFGIVAWGVGVLVGLGTATLAGKDVSGMTGVTAAVIALCSIAGGKFAVIHAMASQIKGEIHAKLHVEENEALVGIANQLVEEAEQANRKLDWPKDSSRDAVRDEKYFPVEIWKDAKARWAAMSPSQQESYKRDYEQHLHATLDASVGQAESEAFLETFSFFDILWAILAVGSAFKLGSGNIGGDD